VQELVKEFAFTEVAAREAFEKVLEVMEWFEYYDGLTPGAKGKTRFYYATERLFMQIDDLASSGNPTLEGFCEWWVSRDLQDAIDESIPAVQISTIHGWKGLENDVIICPDWTDGKFPNIRSDPEEERRLAYVAITRAREAVHIFYGAGPSNFLFELGMFEEYVDEEEDEDYIGMEK
ncbi:MAG: ATP-binding domain-containing protein, partial [Candidatus Marinimicrobia bacterium]|nr:ATP-binding domain-containing protein [Candidatus Neomarinimicrobiota bacterium]